MLDVTFFLFPLDWLRQFWLRRTVEVSLEITDSHISTKHVWRMYLTLLMLDPDAWSEEGIFITCFYLYIISTRTNGVIKYFDVVIRDIKKIMKIWKLAVFRWISTSKKMCTLMWENSFTPIENCQHWWISFREKQSKYNVLFKSKIATISLRRQIIACDR